MTKNAKSPVTVRIRTRARRRSLDEKIARGVDASSSAELSLRADQLTSPTGRLQLANAVVAAVGQARAGYLGPFRKKLQRRDAAIRESADDLLALARRLRDDQPVEARGAALASRLLHDRTSPLRRDRGPELQHAVRAALVALDRPGEPTHELATAV
jgi:hypothetical protein